jgi:hypothetical protein
VRTALGRAVAVLGLLGAALAPATPTAAQADKPFAPILGNWDRHGFGITVRDDGGSSAEWRIYQWCGPGVPEPCDRIIDNELVSGGHAVIRFSGGPDGSGAFQGEVLETTDPDTLDLGPMRLTPQQYDMALLEQGDMQLVLCGEDSVNQAPSDVLMQCGA